VIRTPGRSNQVLWLLAAALFAAVALAIGYARASPPALDVGGRDARFVAGFHAPETFLGPPVRWTAGDATIALPRPPAGAAASIVLRLFNGRPPQYPPPVVELSADGRPLGSFAVSGGAARVVRVLVPPTGQFDWAIRLGIHSDTIVPPNDPRPLGVRVSQSALAPLGGGPRLPTAWLLVWSVALGALGYALPRSMGVRREAALAAAALLAASLAVGVAIRPLELLPFLHRIVALIGLAYLGLWLARILTNDQRPTTDDDRETGRQGDKETAKPKLNTQHSTLKTSPPSSILHPRWSVRGCDLPIYLLVAWWLGPLFQLIMTADGATGVSPAPQTVWIGGVAAALLLGLGLWRLLWGRGRGPEARSSSARRAALLILGAAAAAHGVYLLWFAFQRQAPDFWILFKGAREWARGGSLYDINAVLTNHFGYVFKVPPFYGMLFVPFVFQDGERILLFHRMLNTLLLGATFWAWYRMWGLRLLSVASVGALALLNLRPLSGTIALGQIDLALLLILTLALWALRRERDLLAGALVALGTLFKIYPVLLLGFLLVKRRWRGLAGFALGMLLFNALAVAVMGWEMHRIYLTQVLPNIGGTTAWVENQTVSGFITRLFAPPMEATIFRDRTISLLGQALSGALILLACALALRPARPDSTAYALQYSLFLLLMVLAVPAAWMHYETLLFIPFGALLLHLRDRTIGAARAAALAASFALIAYGNQWSFFDGTVMGVLTIAGVSYKFYGMLLLGGVLAGTLLEQRAPFQLPRWLPVPSLQRQVPRI
jgi:hypothetical protein